MTNRQQKVVIDGFTSPPEVVNAGVPQGSVLGYFIFLLYTNDIFDDLSNNIRLFADDTCTSLYAVIDNDVTSMTQSLTNDLERIDKWSKKSVVGFNPDTTVTIDFSKKTFWILI